MRLRDRSATDLAVLGIVFIIGSMLILSAVAIILIELIHPETDTDALIRIESEILGVLVGALVGFIGGRSAGRNERDQQPPP
jgi:hypothetical protein